MKVRKRRIGGEKIKKMERNALRVRGSKKHVCRTPEIKREIGIKKKERKNKREENEKGNAWAT